MDGPEPRRVPVGRYDRLHSGDDRMPEHADQKVRYVFVYLETVDRKPVGVRFAELGVLMFDTEGKLDQTAESEQMRLAVDGIDPVLSLQPRTQGAVQSVEQSVDGPSMTHL